MLAHERPRSVSSFDLEAPLTRKVVRQPEVVEQRGGGHHLRVVRDAIRLSEPDGEQPGSDGMVEENRVRMGPGPNTVTSV